MTQNLDDVLDMAIGVLLEKGRTERVKVVEIILRKMARNLVMVIKVRWFSLTYHLLLLSLRKIFVILLIRLLQLAATGFLELFNVLTTDLLLELLTF